MPVLVPLLCAEGEIDLSDAQAELLAGILAATIDRKLAGERDRMRLRGKSRTKPGSLLKHQIGDPHLHRLLKLRKENAELKRANEILKTASAYVGDRCQAGVSSSLVSRVS